MTWYELTEHLIAKGLDVMEPLTYVNTNDVGEQIDVYVGFMSDEGKENLHVVIGRARQ